MSSVAFDDFALAFEAPHQPADRGVAPELGDGQAAVATMPGVHDAEFCQRFSIQSKV